MPSKRQTECLVGCFMLLGLGALLVLAFKMSGLSSYAMQAGYDVRAQFDNVGDLKVRAPITVAGVRVGQVSHIHLDPITFKAIVTLHIDAAANKIPSDSSASIFTQGLLGSNYISLNPGFDVAVLKDGDFIRNTHPALILENLIGQFLFNIKK